MCGMEGILGGRLRRRIKGGELGKGGGCDNKQGYGGRYCIDSDFVSIKGDPENVNVHHKFFSPSYSTFLTDGRFG